MLWRELHRRLLGRSAWWWVGVVVLLLVLLSLYGMAAVEDGLEDESFHALLTGLYLLLVLLEAGVYAPPTITSEKESSTWPILLSTTLSGRSVVTSKAVGVMRRLIPISLLLVGHVVLFTLVGVLHPIAMVHTLVISVGFMSFLIALGLWFSLRMRRTTGAVVATILTGFTLWAILPVLVGIFWVLFLNDDGGLQAMVAINPLFWMGTAAAGAAEAIGSASYSGRPAYDLPVGRSVGMGEFTGWLVVVCGAYTAVAAGLLAHSIARFNRVSGRTS